MIISIIVIIIMCIYLSIYLSISLSLSIYIYIYISIPANAKTTPRSEADLDLFGRHSFVFFSLRPARPDKVSSNGRSFQLGGVSQPVSCARPNRNSGSFSRPLC